MVLIKWLSIRITEHCLKVHHIFMLSVGNFVVSCHIIILKFVFKCFKFLGNEAMKNLKTFKKPQSILATGITGSGKTENCKHLIEFLCQRQNVSDSSFIMEAFGNAKTRMNDNSSRFCKYVEVFFIYLSILSVW